MAQKYRTDKSFEKLGLQSYVNCLNMYASPNLWKTANSELRFGALEVTGKILIEFTDFEFS